MCNAVVVPYCSVDCTSVISGLIVYVYRLCQCCFALLTILFQNELKEKDLAIRKFEQEIDSLSFRNNQLSMRVNVLQQELDEAHARGKKHKVRRCSA